MKKKTNMQRLFTILFLLTCFFGASAQGSERPITWQEWLTNDGKAIVPDVASESIWMGNAETPWPNWALETTDGINANWRTDRASEICAWSLTMGKNFDDQAGDISTDSPRARPYPADIEAEEGNESNHVFAVHVDKIDIIDTDASVDWSNQFCIECTHGWKEGQPVRIKFRYKADHACKAGTQWHQKNPSIYNIWNAAGDVEFSTEWKEFDKTLTIHTDGTNDTWSLAFNLCSDATNGRTPNVFYFDDLSWETMVLDEGYFVASSNTAKGIEYDLDNAIEFQPSDEEGVLVATVGTPGKEATWVNEIMISTVRGHDASFKSATLKPLGNYIGEDIWGDYTEGFNAKIKLPAVGVWTIYLAIEDRQINIVKVEEDDPQLYFNFIKKGKIAELIQNPNKYKGTVIIPSKVTHEGEEYTVTKIADKAFSGCSGLTSVTIPNSVTSIGYSAFSGCSGLISVTIPNSVVSIGNGAFLGCSGLTSVTIPNSVTSIGSWTFSGCNGLTSITIPNSVTSIGSYAFAYCIGLTSVTIPNSVISIGGNAFEQCSGLKSASIGSGINIIESEAFSNCSGLTDVYCYAEKLRGENWDGEGLYTNPNAFQDSYPQTMILHVPKGCSDAYTDVEPWKNFKNIVEMADAKVKLSKTKAVIEKGKTLTLKATITPSDLPDKSVTWKSSNTKVATVTSAGKVKGVKAGTATITCTSKATGAKATCKVTVGYVKLDKTEAVINKGKTMTLKATVYPSTLTDRSVTWKSSNTKVATVTSKGKVKGVKPGTATITCTSNATGLKTTCKVTVGYVKLDQNEVTVKKGKTLTLKAAVYPLSLTDKSVTWESSNTKVATVTSKGKVKSVKAGKTLTLKAAVYPLSLTDKSVTWESSNTKVATVTSKGKVKSVKAGLAVITQVSEVKNSDFAIKKKV